MHADAHAGVPGQAVVPALRCARVWLDLDIEGCGTSYMSPGDLHTSEARMIMDGTSL